LTKQKISRRFIVAPFSIRRTSCAIGCGARKLELATPRRQPAPCPNCVRTVRTRSAPLGEDDAADVLLPRVQQRSLADVVCADALVDRRDLAIAHAHSALLDQAARGALRGGQAGGGEQIDD